MKHPLRSAVTTTGRRMAGARSLWRANGMREEQFGRPIIGIANSFTQLVPGHVHLHEIGQQVKQRIEACGCFAAEFDTIAVDDGIAMGHDGMLYSLPSREIIADSVEYMANAHCIDALVCISNCDKITPGMLMAAMRLNIPTVFVSGGPMEAGRFGDRDVDLIDAMVMGADDRCSDEEAARIERCACPGCGSCSGMFTANSMNCLTEALGLSLPGNGTIVATHANRRRLFEDAAALIVRNAERYYFEGDDSLLPRSIATKAAFENAMSLDIAMGGSTNTVLHLLAVAHEAGVDFTMHDIDRLSRKVPVLCKVAPNSHYHIQDVNRAGGILSILGELDRAKLVDTSVRRIDGRTLGEALLESEAYRKMKECEDKAMRNQEAAQLMGEIIAFFRSFMTESEENEAMAQIYWDKAEKRFFAYVPKQSVCKEEVEANLHDCPYDDEERYICYADIHSHNSMDAFFSGKDDRDECSTGLYLVLGKLDHFYPEIKARIFCGDSFVPIDPDTVVEGLERQFPREWLEQVSIRRKESIRVEKKRSFMDRLAEVKW